METAYHIQLQEKLNLLLELPKYIFGVSFGLGTLILLFAIFGDARDLAYSIGALYLILAVFANAAFLAAMILCSFIFKEQQKEILERVAILLLNIPIAILYLYIAFSGIINEQIL